MSSKLNDSAVSQKELDVMEAALQVFVEFSKIFYKNLFLTFLFVSQKEEQKLVLNRQEFENLESSVRLLKVFIFITVVQQ